MSLLPIEIPWDRKPGTIPRLNRKHPIVKGLIFFPWILGDGRIIDLVSGAIGTIVAGTITSSISLEGEIATASGSERMDFDVGHHGIGTGAFTMSCRYKFDGTDQAFQTVLSLDGSEIGFYIPVSKSVSPPLCAVDSINMSTKTFISGGVLEAPDNEWHTFAYSVSGSGNPAQGYRDGVYQADTAGNLTYTSETEISKIHLFFGQSTEDCNGDMLWGGIWNRVLTAREHYLIHENIWQILIPETTYLSIVEAVGGVTGKSNPLHGPLGGPLYGPLG